MQPRSAMLDGLRGVLIAAMVLWHGLWSFAHFGHLPLDLMTRPAAIWSARLIAGGFLLVSGIAFSMSVQDGWNSRRFWRRWLLLTGAAALVSVASIIATPQAPILFGILHLLAACSLIGAGLRKVPRAALLILAGVILALPLIDALRILPGWILPGWILPLGLQPVVPPMGDYTPLIPWAGLYIIGLAIGRRWPVSREGKRWPAILTRPGRHSLAIYLVHQPLLFGAAALLATVAPPRAVADYRGACAAACVDGGGAETSCTRLCACVADQLPLQFSTQQEADAARLCLIRKPE
jgi:uncharacterized membrane protein